MSKTFIILFILLFPAIGNYMITQECPSQSSTWSLRFLYQNRIGSKVRCFFTDNKIVSVLVGKFADTCLSKHAIPLFRYVYNVQVNEYELMKPLHEFTSLNDFFKRSLKPEARPFDQDDAVLCSPADGYVWYASINNDLQFTIKNATFTLETFLGNEQLAQEYQGGTIIVVRIAPHHYHRFHAPCHGTCSSMRNIAGKYESVNIISCLCGVPVLQENERGIITLQATPFDQVLMIPVGALCVGRIKTTYEPDAFCKKGADMGYFEFGGSTVVLVFKKNTIKIADEIQKALSFDQEFEVRAGQKIATAKK